MPKEFQVDYQGQPATGVEVDFEIEREGIALYRLSDGSTARVKTSLMRVVRVKDKFDKHGKPVYMLTFTSAVETEAKDERLTVPPDTTGQTSGQSE